MVVGVGVQVWSMLPQIGSQWLQGRLVVAMGRTSACGMVVVKFWWPTGRMVSVGSQGNATNGWWYLATSDPCSSKLKGGECRAG